MAVSRNPWERKYALGEQKTYALLKAPPAREPARLRELALAREIREAETGERPKRAVWIVHGMGQQLPFETLDGLAEGIMRVASPLAGQDDFEPRANTVQIGDQVVQRVELNVSWKGREAELHLYEAYWAPVTEGQVKLGDVISFLFNGSFRGLLNTVKPFHRAMFGGGAIFKIPKRAALEIAMTVLTLVALIALNAVIVAAGASKYGLTGQKFPHLTENWVPLSAIASALSAVAISFGLILFLAELTRPAEAPPWVLAALHKLTNLRKSSSRILRAFAGIPEIYDNIVRATQRFITLTTWLSFAFTILAIIIGAGFLFSLAAFSWPKVTVGDPIFPELQAFATLAVLLAIVLFVTVLVLRGIFRSAGENLWGPGTFIPYLASSLTLFLCTIAGPLCIVFKVIRFSTDAGWVFWISKPVWVWPFLLILSSMVRQIMVEYVGDVAAYITPNKLDRFNEIRQKIKKIAFDSAHAVFLAGEGGEFLYQKVAVVGHSLGTVIAYDTLNSLLNMEEVARPAVDLGIARRTCLFETFGSPLDKVAFFFSIQGKDAFFIRELLAEDVQPLIRDYARFRRFPWVNIYSLNDIISGKVQMYDFPENQAPNWLRQLIADHHVQHDPDPDAIVPLVAHVEYWKNRKAWEVLLDHVM